MQGRNESNRPRGGTVRWITYPFLSLFTLLSGVEKMPAPSPPPLVVFYNVFFLPFNGSEQCFSIFL